MPYKPNKKHLVSDMQGSFFDPVKEKVKVKTKPKFEESAFIKNFKYLRDMDFLNDPTFPEEDKLFIREKYNLL